MGVTLYKPGVSHTINGIKCTLEVFKPNNFKTQLMAGWYKSPEECYPNKKDPKAKVSLTNKPEKISVLGAK